MSIYVSLFNRTGSNSEREHILAANSSKREKNEEYVKGGQKSVFVGRLHENLLNNRVLQKKEEARKKAFNIINDAFSADRMIDEDIQSRKDRIAQLSKENQTLQSEVKDIASRQQKLQEESGISDDSQEQKDLELLRKQDAWWKGKGPALTEDEMKRIDAINKEGLTEYQKRQREWDGEKEHFQKQIDENNSSIIEENAIIRGMQMERMKSSPMVKAQKEADKILQEASKEILGIALEDAMEYMEEERQEEEKKSQLLEEQHEKVEEFIESQRDKNKEASELLEDMPVEELLIISAMKEEIKGQIDKIVSDMKLVAEDIKGTMVDKEA